MNCEICGGKMGVIVVLLPVPKSDGSLNTVACLGCAEESSAYCIKHRRPHMGFLGGETVCAVCVKEMMQTEEGQTEAIFNRFRTELPEAEFKRLKKWAEPVSSLIGCSPAVHVLCGVVAKALRSGQSVKRVVDQVVASKSVDLLLPRAAQGVII